MSLSAHPFPRALTIGAQNSIDDPSCSSTGAAASVGTHPSKSEHKQREEILPLLVGSTVRRLRTYPFRSKETQSAMRS